MGIKLQRYGLIPTTSIGLWSNPAGATATTNQAATTTKAVVTTANYSIGQIVTDLPAGCITPTVQGTTYYLRGNNGFAPAYGANGVYYRVVPAS